jgi:hypothetical protein
MDIFKFGYFGRLKNEKDRKLHLDLRMDTPARA